MKFRRKLVVFYLIATLLSASLSGLAVLMGIQRLSMDTVESQLMSQSKLAEMYISQFAFLEGTDANELSPQTANRIITSLSLVLGNIRLYDTGFNLLASTETSVKSAVSDDENLSVLTQASKGNYAYMVRNNTVYFASPLEIQGETFGLLEIIYPMNFLTTLMSGVTGILLVGAAGFALLMTLLSLYIAARVTKPITQLAVAANQFANRNFTPVNIKSSGEIAQLCRSFNAMGTQLEEYIQRQKLFVSNVSHELRTPLTAIKGYSEYLAEEVKGGPDIQKAVYHLNNESIRLAKLVDEVLTLSRIDSGRERLVREKLNFSGLLEETLNKMSVRAEKYAIKVKTEISPDIYMMGDGEKLVQVLVNLLDNAFKFSPPQTSVWVRLYREGSQVVLTIADQGMGIPPDQITQVFERFYRAENASGVPGTGLGLAIAKQIADAHKGSIELAAGANGGTTATVKLPAGL